jgi:hypothetical protein
MSRFLFLFILFHFLGAKREENILPCLVNDPQGKRQENHA